MLGDFIDFNNGEKCPQLGFGTFLAPGEECYDAVCHAIDAGYRHIDTARLYFNEEAVGRAISQKIKEAVIERKDIFITTKLWISDFNEVERAARESLQRLGLDYLDLYLIHNPMGLKSPNGPITSVEQYFESKKIMENMTPEDKYDTIHYVEVWEQMEKLVDLNLTKSIGVSNFNEFQITRLLTNCRIKPVTNQVECHPWLDQFKLENVCKTHDIVLTAYGPIGAPGRPTNKHLPVLMEDSTIKMLAKRHNKTSAQIILRFAIQRRTIIIPKSTKKHRIYENGNIFDFDLNGPEMFDIFAMNKDQRFFPLGFFDHKFFPFRENYAE